MEEAIKISNRLNHAWSNTNASNWDAIEGLLKNAKKRIDAGVIHPTLTSTYKEILEAFKATYGEGNMI